MTRRRFRTRGRRSFFGRKSRRSRGRGSSSGVKPLQFDAMAYGALRGKAAELLTPLTAMLPLGEFSDEVSMGVVDYFLAKNSSGFVRDMAMKGLTFENVLLGSDLSKGLPMLGTSNTSSSSVYNFG